MAPRTRTLATALTLAAAAAVTLGAQAVQAQQRSKRPVVEEPESGIELPVTLNVLDTMEGHTLTGVAIREKTIFKVDVYACGHYVDADAAREELAKWKGKKAAALAADDGFRKKLVSPGFARTLRLHLARDIDAEDFNDAFEESLEPRVKDLVEDGVKGSMKDLATFKGLFTLDELAENTKLDFTWKGTTLTVRMDAKQLGAIDSDALCRALWDVYFGDDPIQEEFPEKLISRFPGILKDAAKAEKREAHESGDDD